MAESSPTHDHIGFTTESITGARVCTGCGAFVLSSLQDEHQAFHDRSAQARAPLAAPFAKSKKTKAKKKD